LIDGLYEISPLREVLVLKGGNALRKAYFPLTRFSDDLDFSTSVGLEPDTLMDRFNEICRFAQARSGVQFDFDRNVIAGEHVIDQQKRVYKLRLYFQDFTGAAEHLTLRVKLDVTEFDRIQLPVQQRRLIHPYSDSAECNADVRVVKLEEALADKLNCLIQRRYAYDLFDLVYGLFVNRELDVNRGELVHTFLRKSIFERSPISARDLLLGVPFNLLEQFWERIVCPSVYVPSFERAVGLVSQGLASLFAPFNYGPRLAGTHFPAAIRNPILQAAADLTLLKLWYRGQPRLVEPYALAFKVRRSDGVAQEYFYAYDRTGGHSGPGIKSFVRAGIQRIENTDLKFQPRYTVELAKSAGPSRVGYFGSAFSSGGPPGAGRARRVPKRQGPTYRIQCTYCGKTFTRKAASTQLNKHKDTYGNYCYGRVGIRVS
jgi:predicted nucleotidyltransferase component of viral defense system